ncbi:MAG: hypothetical protein ACTSXY_09130 [Promethearchaeota archaeon]
MLIDILTSSCGRFDILERSIKTFKDNVYTNQHRFRWVLMEDYVEDKKRREAGLEWIAKHDHLFNQIIICKEKFGIGYQWQEIVKYCITTFHFHLEDDAEFLTGINIDPLIEIMLQKRKLVEILWRRQNHVEVNPRPISVNGIDFVEVDFMSESNGLYNTALVMKIFKESGIGTQMHEASVSTPSSMRLGLRKYLLGRTGQIQYTHVGKILGYDKGKYK